MLIMLQLAGRLCAMMALLPGCATEAQRPLPIYANLASATARVDPGAAAGLIGDYRQANGVHVLVVDPTLQRLAEEEARAMAASDKPASASALQARLARTGIKGSAANLSAGYQTLAEAFSGWRESPVHNRTMLTPGATRLGIATAFAPGSKYKVYWALIVSQ